MLPKIFLRNLTGAFVASAFCMMSGCATVEKASMDSSYATMNELEQKSKDAFSDIPSIVKVPLKKSTFQIMEPVLTLPPGIDRNINANFNSAEIEQILHSIAERHGINVVYQPSAQSQPAQSTMQPQQQGAQPNNQLRAVAAMKNKPVTINFSGKLSDLLKTLSKVSGYFIGYENGVIMVKESDTFNVSIPSYSDVYKEIENSLRSLGASGTSYDKFSSTISFSADFNTLGKIKSYCQSLSENALFITLRIMLLNVVFNEEKNTGIDWTKVVFGFKGQQLANLGNKAAWGASSSGSASTSGSSDGASGSASGVLGPTTGFGYTGTNTGAQLFIEGANFSLSMLMNFLEKYGKSDLMQDVFAGAMSGSKGHLDALDTEPYISEISFQALSQVTTPSQAMKTATTSTGVEMDFTPYYSEKEGTLTIPLKIVASSATLVALNAGSQIGQVTLPKVSQKKIDTVLLMSPSQVAVIGGLVHEQNNSTGSGLPGESLLTKTYMKRKQKEVLVAVVKPTIYKFERE